MTFRRTAFYSPSPVKSMYYFIAQGIWSLFKYRSKARVNVLYLPEGYCRAPGRTGLCYGPALMYWAMVTFANISLNSIVNGAAPRICRWLVLCVAQLWRWAKSAHTFVHCILGKVYNICRCVKRVDIIHLIDKVLIVVASIFRTVSYRNFLSNATCSSNSYQSKVHTASGVTTEPVLGGWALDWWWRGEEVRGKFW